MQTPLIIYGTAWKKADTRHWVTTAIQQRFRGIDTACQPKHYDEAGVGAGVAACLDESLTRADLYLQTKFTSVAGQDPLRIPYDSKAPLPEQVTQSFATSLRNLRTDYLDCLLLHSPFGDTKQTLEAWQAMESLVADGGVRQLGISNCYRLRYLTQSDVVPLTGTRSEAHMHEDLSIFEFELTNREREAVDTIF
jgi:diketogulonate reductase-like aldo/keto reductase